MPLFGMDNLRDVPLPEVADTPIDGPSVRLYTTELDDLLDQFEHLSHQHPEAAETLQATLLAKRLSPIRHLITPLNARAAHYRHQIRPDRLPPCLQTDLIAPLLNGLESYLKSYTDPECLGLRLERGSEHIQAQLYTDTRTIGKPVTLAYRYALDEALLVEHRDQVYAISPQHLIQVVRLPRKEWQGDDTTVRAHGRAPVPIGCVRELHTLFESEQTTSPLPDTVNLLLTRTQGTLRVDQILGYRRRLIRPISLPGSPLPWLSGGSRLPDGRIALHIELSSHQRA